MLNAVTNVTKENRYAKNRESFMVRLEKINLLEQITSGPANSDKMRLLWKRGSGVTMKIPKKIQLRKMPGEPKKNERGKKNR